MNAENTAAESPKPKVARLPPRWFIHSAWIVHRTALRLSRRRFGLRTATADRSGYLQLATSGRRTGKERSAILAYIEDGPRLITLAMNGWGQDAPAWWLNLEAQPDARVCLADGSRPVRARAADKDERARLWPMLSGGAWGDLESYAARRARETPIVILEPRS